MKKIIRLLFLYLLLALGVTVSAKDYPKLTFNGHTYQVIDQGMSFKNAQAYCESLGGHLAVITSQSENDALETYGNKCVPGGGFMIGLYDAAGSNGTWDTWVTGEKVTYSNWGYKQPDWTGQTICALTTTDNSYYGWYSGQWDNGWDGDYWFICEWDYLLNTSQDIEQEIVSAKDNDLKNSRYELLQAKIKKTTKNSLTLTWKKISSADGYMIYGNKCGTQNKYQYICTLDNPSATKYVAKGLKKGTYYKFFVVAYKNMGNQKATITISKTIHSITKGGSYGNAKDVKITKLGASQKNTSAITLKVGKSATIKGTSIKQDKIIRNHRGLAFESTNPKVAKVTKKGKITAKGTGTCKIFVYAQNGVSKTIRVTVKN